MSNLRLIRVNVGLTQQELATLSACTQPTISAFESGSVPNVDLARSILKALNSKGGKYTLDDVFPIQNKKAA